MRVNRGFGEVETVTDSFIRTEKSILGPRGAPVGEYVPAVGVSTEEMMGAVRSIVMVVDAGEFAAGPLELVTVPKT